MNIEEAVFCFSRSCVCVLYQSDPAMINTHTHTHTLTHAQTHIYTQTHTCTQARTHTSPVRMVRLG